MYVYSTIEEFKEIFTLKYGEAGYNHFIELFYPFDSTAIIGDNLKYTRDRHTYVIRRLSNTAHRYLIDVDFVVDNALPLAINPNKIKLETPVLHSVIAPSNKKAIETLTKCHGFDDLMLKTLYHLTDEEFDDYLNHTTRYRQDCINQRNFEIYTIDEANCVFESDSYQWAGMDNVVTFYDFGDECEAKPHEFI